MKKFSYYGNLRAFVFGLAVLCLLGEILLFCLNHIDVGTIVALAVCGIVFLALYVLSAYRFVEIDEDAVYIKKGKTVEQIAWSDVAEIERIGDPLFGLIVFSKESGLSKKEKRITREGNNSVFYSKQLERYLKATQAEKIIERK